MKDDDLNWFNYEKLWFNYEAWWLDSILAVQNCQRPPEMAIWNADGDDEAVDSECAPLLNTCCGLVFCFTIERECSTSKFGVLKIDSWAIEAVHCSGVLRFIDLQTYNAYAVSEREASYQYVYLLYIPISTYQSSIYLSTHCADSRSGMNIAFRATLALA